MWDQKTFRLAILQLSQERNLPVEKVKEAIEAALAAAYKKDYGKKNQKIKAELDLNTGELKFWQVKLVVDETMLLKEEEKKEKPEEERFYFNPERHLLIEEARKIKPEAMPGEEIEIPLKTEKDFGRIAAQTAKQVILQKIRELEKQTLINEYKSKEGAVITGICQRVEKNNVYFDLGKSIGLLPKEEQIPSEFYKIGQRFKLYVLKVEESPKGPTIILSRAFPKLVSKLFEMEVPEIEAGQIEIKSVAREPGSRTKIAVASLIKELDPIGAMVGQKGTRVMAVISELGGEKIDIVQYSEDPEIYIRNALSPAKILEVKIEEPNKAVCFVEEDQLSLAIGKDGQNVRLASKLTGWKIDVEAKKDEKDEKENH
jgi:N utilization substance protein A